MASELKSVLERFNKKYNIDADTGCWIWKGSPNSYGYGRICINYKSIAAHRLSYTLFVGEIPDGSSVCHKCDNPICVNPAHLFLGTHQDNMTDMVKKGRSFSGIGETSPSVVLTEEQAQYILDFPHYRGSVTMLAEKFGVSISTISYVKSGKSWKHLKKSLTD